MIPQKTIILMSPKKTIRKLDLSLYLNWLRV